MGVGIATIVTIAIHATRVSRAIIATIVTCVNRATIAMR